MWQPMSLAPRDGRLVEVRLMSINVADRDVTQARWDSQIRFWTTPAGTVLIPEPAGWRELRN